MKLFLSYLAIVGAVVFIILVSFEVYVEEMPNPARDKHQWMMRNSSNVEILVLGSSHTFYGVSPRLLGRNSYSLAQVSQTYRYDWELLRHYPMPKLKYVILPFSYFSLWEDFEQHETGSSFHALSYCIYMDVRIHGRWSKYGLEILSLNSFREKIRSLWLPAQLSWDEYGFGTNYTYASRPLLLNIPKRVAELTYNDLDTYNLNKGFLKNIISYCQKRDIRVLLLTTPVKKDFYRHEDFHQVRYNKKVLNDILKQYSNVTYVDLETDDRFVDRDFYDADHLDTDGAYKVSKILRQYIEQY